MRGLPPSNTTNGEDGPLLSCLSPELFPVKATVTASAQVPPQRTARSACREHTGAAAVDFRCVAAHLHWTPHLRERGGVKDPEGKKGLRGPQEVSSRVPSPPPPELWLTAEGPRK